MRMFAEGLQSVTNILCKGITSVMEAASPARLRVLELDKGPEDVDGLFTSGRKSTVHFGSRSVTEHDRLLVTV